MPDVRAKPAEGEATAKQASSSTKVDPWLASDPWAKKNIRPVQSKWEDLVIQDPLPFVNKDDASLKQSHHLQLGPGRGGIVLSTKVHLAEISKIPVSADLAILIPATDAGALPHVAKRLEGPFEVSLTDTKAQTAYKRLVHMIVLSGSVRFQLPKAKFKVTTPSIAELVLEIDSRLVMKADFDRMKESPIASFRQLVQQVAPHIDTGFVLYGYRLSNHPGATKQEAQMQCVLKAPLLGRKALLESSGTTELLVRDYMDKGKGTDDTTVLPRFWGSNPQELQRMRIAVSGTPGFAGIVVTRRGLAVRVWTDSIKEARTALLAGDPRLVPENLHVIPRHTVELSGWPAATDAANVVKSTLAAISTPVVPLRTYRAAGVHTWVVAVDAIPKVSRFTLDINDDLVEILLQEAPAQQQVRPSKGKAKGKGKQSKQSSPRSDQSFAWSAKPVVPAPSKAEDSRLDRLEDRFDKLEARQVNFESKVDNKFDNIQDSLRQLLANTNPRARDPSGDTPQPKFPKNA